MALAEIDLAEAVVQHLDVEGVLAFDEHLLLNVDRLWMTVGFDEKQKLQQVGLLLLISVRHKEKG